MTRWRQQKSLVMGIATALLGLAAPQIGAAAVNWEYVENSDPYAKGIVAVAQRSEGDGARAMVRCWSATRVFDLRLGFPDVGNRALRELQLQFDVSPSVTPAWRPSPNRRTVIIAREDHARVLAGLRRSNDVTLVADFADGSRQTSVLHLRGSSAAIGRVLEVCGPLETALR